MAHARLWRSSHWSGRHATVWLLLRHTRVVRSRWHRASHRMGGSHAWWHHARLRRSSHAAWWHHARLRGSHAWWHHARLRRSPHAAWWHHARLRGSHGTWWHHAGLLVLERSSHGAWGHHAGLWRAWHGSGMLRWNHARVRVSSHRVWRHNARLLWRSSHGVRRSSHGVRKSSHRVRRSSHGAWWHHARLWASHRPGRHHARAPHGLLCRAITRASPAHGVSIHTVLLRGGHVAVGGSLGPRLL